MTENNFFVNVLMELSTRTRVGKTGGDNRYAMPQAQPFLRKGVVGLHHTETWRVGKVSYKNYIKRSHARRYFSFYRRTFFMMNL